MRSMPLDGQDWTPEPIAAWLERLGSQLQKPAPVGLGPTATVTDTRYTLARLIVVLGEALWRKDAAIGEALGALFDANAATGVALDVVGYSRGVARLPAQRARMTALVYGTPGLPLGGQRVKDSTGFEWLLEPMVIPVGGIGEAVAVAIVDGAAVVYGTPYTIVSIVTGFNTFVGVALASNGRLAEVDIDMRPRVLATLSTRGGVEYAWDKRLREVAGVTASKSTMNRQGEAVNGIPPHHGEAVVTGGTDLDVATTLLLVAASATAGFAGNTTVNVPHPQDVTLGTYPVKFSRSVDLRGYVVFTMTTTGATNPQPPLRFAWQVRRIVGEWTTTLAAGRIPLSIELEQYVSARVQQGSIVKATAEFSRDGISFVDILALSKYERFQASSVAMPAIVVGLVMEPYALAAGWQLDLSIDGMFVQSVVFVGTEVTLALVLATMAAAALVDVTASVSAGNTLQLASITVGVAGSIEIMNTSTPALLAALGLALGVTLGSPSDIGVTAL